MLIYRLLLKHKHNTHLKINNNSFQTNSLSAASYTKKNHIYADLPIAVKNSVKQLIWIIICWNVKKSINYYVTKLFYIATKNPINN